MLFVPVFAHGMSGYSMLTHEQIVDLAWPDPIQALLKQGFSEGNRRRAQRGACLCLAVRASFKTSAIIHSVIIQQAVALRSQRRLRCCHAAGRRRHRPRKSRVISIRRRIGERGSSPHSCAFCLRLVRSRMSTILLPARPPKISTSRA